MKTKRKSSGFFIVEILIVLVIVGILTLALLPNFQVYMNRAKFQDVISSVGAVKSAVEACIVQMNKVGASPIASCANDNNGVPAAAGKQGNVLSVAVVGTGAITGTAIDTVGSGAETLILTPTYNNDGTITWAKTGTCVTNELC